MTAPPPSPGLSRVLLVLPWLILATLLALTWLVWDHERQTTHKELQSQFDFSLRETVSRIEQRVAGYEQLLRGVQGLFATTALTHRAALHDYVEMLQIDANFSGIQVIGIVQPVPPDLKFAHTASMRRQGIPNYAVHPEGERDFYTPTIQREPDLDHKQAPLGFDPWSDPVRRLAMERARDSGMPAMTGKIRLNLQAKGEVQSGFIMYLPVFSPGKPRDSVAQRRANLIGWIYAAFQMNDFMASLYGKAVPGVDLAIYDGTTPSPQALMYPSGQNGASAQAVSALSASEYMVVAGHIWTLVLGTGPAFEARFGRDVSTLIAVTGVGLSLSLSMLAWFMVTGRERALRLAAKMTEELRHMAQHDPLTGLPNRALFSDRLGQELAYARRMNGHLALVFLDLDSFKPINDNWGHAIGDLLLQQVAQRLQSSVRASDTVARIGGDEFVVLIPKLVGAQSAVGLAEKIRHTLCQPFTLKGHQLTVSCSVGVAVYPKDGQTEMALTQRADEAMYQAKAAGGNRVQRTE